MEETMEQLLGSISRVVPGRLLRVIKFGIPLALVVIVYENKLLFIKRKKAPSQGKWAFITEHLENGETFLQAAIRGVKEEVNLKIIVRGGLKTFTIRIEGKRYLVKPFLAEAESLDLQLNHDEVEESKWLKPEEGFNLDLSYGTRRLLKHFLKATQ